MKSLRELPGIVLAAIVVVVAGSIPLVLFLLLLAPPLTRDVLFWMMVGGIVTVMGYWTIWSLVTGRR